MLVYVAVDYRNTTYSMFDDVAVASFFFLPLENQQPAKPRYRVAVTTLIV